MLIKTYLITFYNTPRWPESRKLWKSIHLPSKTIILLASPWKSLLSHKEPSVKTCFIAELLPVLIQVLHPTNISWTTQIYFWSLHATFRPFVSTQLHLQWMIVAGCPKKRTKRRTQGGPKNLRYIPEPWNIGRARYSQVHPDTAGYRWVQKHYKSFKDNFATNTSGPNLWMKVDENRWKWMKVKKVDESKKSGWKGMKISVVLLYLWRPNHHSTRGKRRDGEILFF